jgi:hypothetical protein
MNCVTARRVVFALVAGTLQVFLDLLVQVAELVAVGGAVEVDLVDPVDHLPQQRAALHVVVAVLEDAAHHGRRVAGTVRHLQAFQRGEKVVVDELQQRVAGQPLVVGRPGPPLQALGHGRDVGVIQQLALLVAVVEDFQEEQPAELADALGVAVHADVLAHDVLDGLDGGAERHGSFQKRNPCVAQ